MRNVEGTHKNAELADFFCSQPHGGPMCSFFQPGSSVQVGERLTSQPFKGHHGDYIGIYMV